MQRLFFKKAVVTILFSVIVILVSAHEFWLEPSVFMPAEGKPFALRFMVGENFHGEVWKNKSKKVQSLVRYEKDGVDDLTALAKADDSNYCMIPGLPAGTHLFVFLSNPSSITLAADKFNAYLKEDGLDNIYTLRKSRNEMNKPASEQYQRYAKTLVQVGKTMDTACTRSTGITLDLIPQSNPYMLKKGEKLPVQILFQQQPLVNQLVVAWCRNAQGVFSGKKNYHTDKNGKVNIQLLTKGIWMISTVRMVPSADTFCDYRSHWGSLTFEKK